jgi:hypothetical protein
MKNKKVNLAQGMAIALAVLALVSLFCLIAQLQNGIDRNGDESLWTGNGAAAEKAALPPEGEKNQGFGAGSDEMTAEGADIPVPTVSLAEIGVAYEAFADGVVQIIVFRDGENMTVIDEGLSRMDCRYATTPSGTQIRIFYPDGTAAEFSFRALPEGIMLNGLLYSRTDRPVFDE